MTRTEKRTSTLTTDTIDDTHRVAVRYDQQHGGYTVTTEYRRHTYGRTSTGYGSVYRWTTDEIHTNHLRREDAEYAARCIARAA